MRHYQLIRRTPLNELSVAEHGVLRLEDAMLYVRKEANTIRCKPWMSIRGMEYFVGMFNGVRFTILMILDSWDDGYEEFKELAERYSAEVDYLAGAYLERRAA